MKNFTVLETLQFIKWFERLKDIKSKVLITKRIERLKSGNFGDCKNIDKDISELRFFIGAGYRIYYTIKGDEIIILINGGDKSSQNKDIQKAKTILKDLEDE